MTSTVHGRWKRWGLPLALGAIYALSRLPIYSAGYGGDGDYWNVAAVAGSFLETGDYVIGRPPGNPLHEFQMIVSLLVADVVGVHGWWIANALTAAWAVLLLWCADRLRGPLGIPDPWRWPLLATLAFLPVFWAHSADGSDHAPATALGLLALLAVLRGSADGRSRSMGWSICAGIVLGLAVGYRLGSVTLAPACGWILLRARRPRDLLAFAFALAAASALCYFPIWWTGQWGLPDPRRHGWVGEGLRAAWRTHSALLPGPVALVLLWVGIRAARVRMRARRVLLAGRPLEQGLLLALVAGLALFALVPRDPAYLLPAAVCWCLLLAKVLRPRQLGAMAVASAAAALVQWVPDYTETGGVRFSLEPGAVVSAVTEGQRIRDYPLRVLGLEFEPGTVVVVERALQGIRGSEFDPEIPPDSANRFWRHPDHPGVLFGGYQVLVCDETRSALAAGRTSLVIDPAARTRARQEAYVDIYDAVTPWPAPVGTFQF